MTDVEGVVKAKAMNRTVRRWAAMGLLLTTLRAAGVDYYVGVAGDDANPGTQEQPFRTLRKAGETLAPGDTCHVGSGVYPETVRPVRSGKFEKPIRYVAATGETVTVTGLDPGAETPLPGRSEGPARKWGFDLEGLSLIEVIGFDLRAAGINLTEASYCRVEACQVWSGGGRSTSGRAWEGAIRVGGRENEISRCSLIGSRGHGLVFLPGSVNNRMSGVLIRGVTNGYGVVVGGTAQIVEQSTIRECSEGLLLCSNLYNGRLLHNDFNGTGREGSAKPLIRITGNGKGTLLAYNWIHAEDVHDGDGVLMEGPVENYLLHHNVIWGLGGSAIRLRGAVRYCLFFNNTCARNGSGLDREGPARDGEMKGLRFFNNLFAGAVWSTTEGKPSAGAIWEKNYVGTSPGFSGEPARPFALSAESPCIDAGQDEPELTDTFSGQGPDVGAYEFGQDFPVPGCQGSDARN
jgi:hypothetical protein